MDFSSDSLELLVAVVSAVIALTSLYFARQAVWASEKVYHVELIGQLYTLYQSDEMLNSLKIAWDIYRQIWIKDCESTESGTEKVNNGVRVRAESAICFFADLDRDSAEFKAIHYLINFWTYAGLLLQKKVITTQEIRAFTSPYILGFLVPMSIAYNIRYPSPNDDVSIFEYLYKKLITDQKQKGRVRLVESLNIR